MGKLNQLSENVKLSEKLAEYIANHPSAIKNLPNEASFVTFSSSNEELNKLNQELITSLKKEGKKVVKAEQQTNKEKPWSFTPTY